MRRGIMLSILQGRRQLPRAVSIQLTEMCNDCKFIDHYWNKDASFPGFESVDWHSFLVTACLVSLLGYAPCLTAETSLQQLQKHFIISLYAFYQNQHVQTMDSATTNPSE